MPFPRFRLRTLLIAVAVAAMIAWVVRLNHLSVEYRQRASMYWFMAPRRMAMGPGSPPWPPPPPPSAFGRWAYQMAAKYERAARYPWLPVAPDPPPPR